MLFSENQIIKDVCKTPTAWELIQKSSGNESDDFEIRKYLKLIRLIRSKFLSLSDPEICLARYFGICGP